MRIKTTQEIKRHNDYKYKNWIEASDVIGELHKIENVITELRSNIEPERKVSDGDEMGDIVEDIAFEQLEKRLKELSQRISNLAQSNESKGRKLDRIYGEIVLKQKQQKEDSDRLWGYIRKDQDRLKMLEDAWNSQIKAQ